MRTTLVKFASLVVPKVLRNRLSMQFRGFVTADGPARREEPFLEDSLVEKDGRLLIPRSRITVTDDFVRALRESDQK